MSLSKVYFGVFKNQGNIRLLFIVGIIPAIITLIALTFSLEIYNKSYDNFYDFHKSNPSYSEKENVHKKYFSNMDRSGFWKFFSYSNEKMNFLTELIKVCDSGQIEKTKNIKYWDGYRHKTEDITNSYTAEDCKRIIIRYKHSPIHINSYIELLHFLWVIFAFYVPFLIVLPIKWITDGFRQSAKK